jgi:ankyrin repeat protein
MASLGYDGGHPDVVRLLLDHGADAQARDLAGHTASEVARGSKQQDIVQLLSQHTVE